MQQRQKFRPERQDANRAGPFDVKVGESVSQQPVDRMREDNDEWLPTVPGLRKQYGRRQQRVHERGKRYYRIIAFASFGNTRIVSSSLPRERIFS